MMTDFNDLPADWLENDAKTLTQTNTFDSQACTLKKCCKKYKKGKRCKKCPD